MFKVLKKHQMSNVQLLIGDLNGLLTDSKRRFPDIRLSCEAAIKVLKSYSLVVPIQEINKEDHKEEILKPFILSCKSGNIKLTNISIPVIHKLILAHLIPELDITQVLLCLLEASNLAVDIQLRILQCLPALMQKYPITGTNLLDMLAICSSLTANNKSSMVVNTASATLQQLFTNIYDSIGESSNEKKKEHEVVIDNDETVKLDSLSHEGFLIFQDLCNFIDNESPTYLKDSIHIKLYSVLEVVESIVHGHQVLFQTHKELTYLLRVRLFPSMLKILNSVTKNFPLVNRTIRIMNVLLSTQLENLKIESEIVLSFFCHLLIDGGETEESESNWEKYMVLELLKNLFSDFLVLKLIFQQFDYNKLMKNVLKELFSVFMVYLQKSNTIVDDIVRPVSRLAPGTFSTDGSSSSGSALHGSNGNYLSRTTSNLKPLVLDHLDKLEPPGNIPSTYGIYLIYQILILFSDGVANFVYNLNDESKDPISLEADVELANALIEGCGVDVSLLYENFIYTSMDDDSFNILIKSFQKFTHATGLLGITATRDRLLVILAKAIIKNTSKNDTNEINSQSHSSGSMLQEQKKHLLAFGGSLVESISTSIAGEGSNETNQANTSSTSSTRSTPVAASHSALTSRYFNSRHVVCLRVLVNTAISLKSTLQDSWNIIWIALQWCGYYLNGPDQFSPYFNNTKVQQTLKESKKPQISAQDVTNVENSIKKLYVSIGDSSVETFRTILITLTRLSDFALDVDNEKYEDELPISSFNKSYFVSRLAQVSEIDEFHNWLIKDEESWDIISSYFIDLGTKRNIHFSLRNYVVEMYMKVIETVAIFGFQHDDLIEETSQKTLNGLNGYLEKLFGMGSSKELLINNRETEIHLLILTTLHTLIDKYDKNYQQTWNEVFKLLNTPFRTLKKDEVEETINYDDTRSDEGVLLKDKTQLLVEKSFDTLKLILDEFLSTLPFNQFKLLIDTLSNFVYQQYDLNISFSSVSYFWLISDSLKSRMVSFKCETVLKSHDKQTEIHGDENKLLELISGEKIESYNFYIYLNIYLLLSLAKISKHEINRAQVRDGAIQTFYQIIDVHGNVLKNKSWDMIYDIVLLPNFFTIVPESRGKDWLDSLQLIFTGLISLYNKFVLNDDNGNGIVVKWQYLIDYFDKLLKLQWIDLNLKIFKSLQDLMTSYGGSKNIKKQVGDLFFKIWSQFPIEYDLINNNYQESLVQYMQCFLPLYKITSKDLSISDMDLIINIFNKCGMYPVLPSNQSDNVKPTNLQNSILQNLKLLSNVDNNINLRPEFEPLVIQQLSNIIIYPYGIRNRIETKLQNNEIVKNKLPTFVAFSHLSLNLLNENLNNFDGVFSSIGNDNAIMKCLKSLLEIIENKSIGINNSGKEQSLSSLWIESDLIFVKIIKKLINHRDNNNLLTNDEFWKLIIQRIEISFIAYDEKNQEINITQYHELIELVLPELLKYENSQHMIEDLVIKLYENSYLYKFNDLEIRLMDQEKYTVDKTIDNLTLYKFDEFFGTTESIEKYPNLRIRLNCLEQLINFLLGKDTNTDSQKIVLKQLCEKYLILRASFTFRRILNDIKLVYKCPIPIVQQKELLMILNGLNELSVNDGNNDDLKKLSRLLIQLIPYSSRINNLDKVLPQVLIKISL